MVKYGQPRRLNVVSFIMILMGLAAGYWVWRFFPAYFDGWTVDHLLKEGASKTYRLNSLNEPERTKQLKELVDKVRADIQKQGNVTDPDLLVSLDLEADDDFPSLHERSEIAVISEWLVAHQRVIAGEFNKSGSRLHAALAKLTLNSFGNRST